MTYTEIQGVKVISTQKINLAAIKESLRVITASPMRMFFFQLMEAYILVK